MNHSSFFNGVFSFSFAECSFRPVYFDNSRGYFAPGDFGYHRDGCSHFLAVFSVAPDNQNA